MFRRILVFSFTFVFLSLSIFAQKKPVISIASRTHDIGTVVRDSPDISYTFHLRNTGDSKLCFLEFVTDCHCLTADYPKTPIQPGAAFDIVLHLKVSGQPYGKFKKGVYWSTNADPANFSLTLSGNIVTAEQASELKAQAQNEASEQSKTSSRKTSNSSNRFVKWLRGHSK